MSYITRLSVLLVGLFALSQSNASELKVTLLGTGTPRPDIERFGPSTLIEYKGHKYLFDVGRGATIRLHQLGINPAEIDYLFLTHLHSDHISGFADFWTTGWIWQRRTALTVMGPEGTESFVEHIKSAFSKDITYREKQTNLPESGLGVSVTKVQDGIIYKNDEVSIKAISVDHGEVNQAYAYRFATEQHSVLVSGDTTFSKNLVSQGKNLDLLIHELAVISPRLLANNPKLRKISEYHASLDDVEKVLNQIKPKQTVFNHLLLIGSGEEAVNKEIQSRLEGNVSLGHDLMRIILPSYCP